jgi:hypothetical protein
MIGCRDLPIYFVVQDAVADFSSSPSVVRHDIVNIHVCSDFNQEAVAMFLTCQLCILTLCAPRRKRAAPSKLNILRMTRLTYHTRRGRMWIAS